MAERLTALRSRCNEPPRAATVVISEKKKI